MVDGVVKPPVTDAAGPGDSAPMREFDMLDLALRGLKSTIDA